MTLGSYGKLCVRVVVFTVDSACRVVQTESNLE